jgi:hypothetical protein
MNDTMKGTTMLLDIETPLITKILEIAAENSKTDNGGVASKLKIKVATPEQVDVLGGGRYSINIAEDTAKELAGLITKFFAERPSTA